MQMFLVPQFASGMGVLLGNIVGAIIRTILSDEQLLIWGWRVPFLSGLVIGFVALLIQMYGSEFNPNEQFYGSESTGDDGEPQMTSSSVDMQQSKHPLTESFRRENLPSLIASALVPMLAGANYYVTFVWYVNGVNAITTLCLTSLTLNRFIIQDGRLYGNNSRSTCKRSLLDQCLRIILWTFNTICLHGLAK